MLDYVLFEFKNKFQHKYNNQHYFCIYIYQNIKKDTRV